MRVEQGVTWPLIWFLGKLFNLPNIMFSYLESSVNTTAQCGLENERR
jgi:hypothetical protein